MSWMQDQRAERCHKTPSGGLQLGDVANGQFGSQPFAFSSEENPYAASVPRVTFAENKALLARAVKQFDEAVMLKLHPLCKIADRRHLIQRQPADRDQKLVVLRLKPARARLLLTEAQKS